MTEPKCSECGNNEFEYRYIFLEGKTQEWKERKIQFIVDGRNEQWIENIKRQFNEPHPCAVVFCIKCGHIVGVAK